MIKILITGADGQLATALKRYIIKKDDKHINTFFVNRQSLDISNLDLCQNIIYNYKPNYIINCAAYTNVDGAESDKNQANLVNSIGPKNLSVLCAKLNIKLIHISTDYVFPEYSLTNKAYTELDKTNPVNYYGLSKLLGEQNIINSGCQYIIIRAGWLYYYLGKNFFNTIYNLAQQKDNLNIVSDQIGTPTYCGAFANFIFNIIKLDQLNNNNYYFNNIYNFSNMGETNWCEFAKEIIKLFNMNCKINPIPSSEYPTPATRPKFSVLNKSKIVNTFNYTPPSWQESLRECMIEKQKIINNSGHTKEIIN